MAGIAKPRPRMGKRIKDNIKSGSELHSLFRRSDTPSGISVPSFSGSSGGSNSGVSSSNFLATSGGTMIGAIAFNYKFSTISSGVLDVSLDGSSYTSRVIVIGQGNVADDLEVITGATHAGQILFFQPIQTVTLQDFQKTSTAWADTTSYSVGDVVLSASQRYTCYTAHTSATATNKPGTGSAWATVWYRNNIRITGATERIVAVDEIILLLFDSTDSVWTVISGGGSSGGVALGDDNVWTGINTFSGTATSFNSPTINLGDGSTDKINFIGTAGTNLDMSDYDIDTVDRLIFSSTGSNNLDTTDYGIGTDSTDSNDLHYNVPSGRSHEFDVAGTQTFHISPTLVTSQVSLWVAGAITITGNTSIRGDTTIGNSSSDTLTVTATPAFNATTSFNSDTTLGTFGGGHEVNFNAKLDFRAHTNSTNQTAGDSDGYIDILVGGLAKKLYYY